MERLAIAIDPSYVPKAGKKSAHIGRFWSGCASAVKHGLEVLGIGLIDADIRDCMMLRAVQTLNAVELALKNLTLPQWYLSALDRYKSELLKITNVLVADAAFSNKPFVGGLLKIGFHLVSRFRTNSALFYLYDGPAVAKRVGPGCMTAR